MATTLSDSKSSIRVSIPKAYKDLSLAFLKHPGTNDVRPLSDIDAVKQSVKNLILTNHGDRPFNYKIGSNLTSLLFEPVGPFTSNAIRTEITEVLAKNEPRINGVRVNVFDESERNAYIIRLVYTVVSLNTEVDTQFYLKRLR